MNGYSVVSFDHIALINTDIEGFNLLQVLDQYLYDNNYQHSRFIIVFVTSNNISRYYYFVWGIKDGQEILFELTTDI